MSGETWTEYAVRSSVWERFIIGPFRTLDEARGLMEPGEFIVGRTVTASDWLPVTTPSTCPTPCNREDQP